MGTLFFSARPSLRAGVHLVRSFPGLSFTIAVIFLTDFNYCRIHYFVFRVGGVLLEAFSQGLFHIPLFCSSLGVGVLSAPTPTVSPGTYYWNLPSLAGVGGRGGEGREGGSWGRSLLWSRLAPFSASVPGMGSRPLLCRGFSFLFVFPSRGGFSTLWEFTNVVPWEGQRRRLCAVCQAVRLPSTGCCFCSPQARLLIFRVRLPGVALFQVFFRFLFLFFLGCVCVCTVWSVE